MNINVICVGKIKESSLEELINEYSKRISKYAILNIIQIADEKVPNTLNTGDVNNIKKIEGQKILSNIKQNDFVIALDLKGIEISSEEFASTISDITLKGFSTIDFIIGGSLGIGDDVIKRANKVVSFSKLTFPHQLFRVFLLEQIFRAFKIINNEKYHL